MALLKSGAFFMGLTPTLSKIEGAGSLGWMRRCKGRRG